MIYPGDPDAERLHPLVPPRALVFILYDGGRTAWTSRTYTALAGEVLERNAVLHRAVRLVTAASLPLTLLDRGRAVSSHSLLALLERQNPREGGQRFLEGVYGHLLVSGNAYLDAALVDGALRELHALRPDRMRVVPGPGGWSVAYDYRVSSETLRDRLGIEGLQPLLHLTLFHPSRT